MADYRGGNRIRYSLKVQGSLVLFAGGARKTGILLYFQGGGCTGMCNVTFLSCVSGKTLAIFIALN
jgi:hypothetical protein